MNEVQNYKELFDKAKLAAEELQTEAKADAENAETESARLYSLGVAKGAQTISDYLNLIENTQGFGKAQDIIVSAVMIAGAFTCGPVEEKNLSEICKMTLRKPDAETK